MGKVQVRGVHDGIYTLDDGTVGRRSERREGGGVGTSAAGRPVEGLGLRSDEIASPCITRYNGSSPSGVLATVCTAYTALLPIPGVG